MMSRGIIVPLVPTRKPDFYRVRDQRLDLDDLAALRLGRDIDQRLGSPDDVLDAGGQRDNDIGRGAPERAVAPVRRSPPAAASWRA